MYPTYGKIQLISKLTLIMAKLSFKIFKSSLFFMAVVFSVALIVETLLIYYFISS